MKRSVFYDRGERCYTGIPGFDELCQGGFVRNSVNSILGGPGAGKSTFLLQFLWNGVINYNENGLFVSFEPLIDDVFNDAMSFGWNFFDLDSNGKCKFIKMSPKTNIRVIKQELMKLISRYDIKRICIDPVSVFSMYIDNELSAREYLFELVSLLKRLKVTVLISDETVDGTAENFNLSNEENRTESIKYLCDGFINLYLAGLGGETDRAIRIIKMRRTSHERGPVPFRITNNGILISVRR